MLKFLRFHIGCGWQGYDEVRLWVYKHSAKYEVLLVSELLKDKIKYETEELFHANLINSFSDKYVAKLPQLPETNKRLPVKNPERLSEWDALNVNSWDNVYQDEDVCDGTYWGLTYREDGKKTRRISGSNAYPPQWKQFIEWLDALMPEMRFTGNIEEEDDIDEDE